MKAFWAPSFRHCDNIFDRKIPQPNEITSDFMQGFMALYKEMPRSSDMVELKGLLFGRLEELEQENPEKFFAAMQGGKRAIRHYDACTSQDLLRLNLSIVDRDSLCLTFYEVSQDLDFDLKYAEAYMPERFSESARYEVSVVGAQQFTVQP
ncbi:MAG: hypothetical protein DI551_11995, partial [Micavibrio aeruginosavorus]